MVVPVLPAPGTSTAPICHRPQSQIALRKLSIANSQHNSPKKNKVCHPKVASSRSFSLNDGHLHFPTFAMHALREKT